MSNTTTNYNNIDDKAIILLIRNGDSLGQDYILNKYKKLVKIKSSDFFLQGADKEDIIQEGMIGLYKAIRDYDTEKDVKFSTFAELCISRQIITAIKMATRQKHRPLNSYVSLNKQISEENIEGTFSDFLVDNKITNPEELFISNEGRKFIENGLLTELSKLEYKVLQFHLQGNSYAQIGEKIGKSEKSVDNTLQRVRKKVNNLLVEQPK